MKENEVISSGLLETYVIGAASDEEIALVQELYKKNPQLIKEIEQIERNLLGFTSAAATPLNPQLKEKIASKLSFKGSEPVPGAAKIISINENKIGFYKFGMAASLLLFVSSFFYTILLQQKFNRLNDEVAILNASRTYMAEELKIQQASLSDMNSELRIVTDPGIKKIALKGMNSLASKSAAVHWNPEAKEVYFNASALPSPSNKQYQLWAIVDGKPVDAGMIDLKGDFVFQKMKTVSGASAFAVTIENMGGSVVPTMETMCFLGNV